MTILGQTVLQFMHGSQIGSVTFCPTISNRDDQSDPPRSRLDKGERR